MLSKKDFYKFLAIRKFELEVTKHFNEMGGNDSKITFNDLTRFLLKKCPKLMKKIDKILEKV